MSSTCLSVNTTPVFSEKFYLQLINDPDDCDESSSSCNDKENVASIPEQDLILYERQNLLEKLNENQLIMLNARSEYEQQYENFINIAKRFYDEKYANLKLQFKNQILKQQIYFEQELFDISNDFKKDFQFENQTKRNKNSIKSYIKLFREDIQKLIDYMKSSLVSSYETLIDAYDTCHVLKAIERIQNGFIVRSDNKPESTDGDDDVLNEQIEFIKYKQEMENLMYILDEIEVQYLNRKDELQKKSKLYSKLKSKLKHIECKYNSLSKSVQKLKYESCMYQELLSEKQRSNVLKSSCSLQALVERCNNDSNAIINNNNCSEYNRKLYLITNLIDYHKKSTGISHQARKVNSQFKSLPTPDSSSLHIYESSYDGDFVSIENRNFKSEYNLHNYSITRQIDNMPLLTHKIETGEFKIKCGKLLSVKTAFNDQLNFLIAIKNEIDKFNSRESSKLSIKINTKLFEPNGNCVSTHIQDIPKFYYDIFKYANLIQFF